MLDDINLDAIPSGETRAAILILAGRLEALAAQVHDLTGNITSEKPAPTPKKPNQPRSQRTKVTTK